jgi:hypothetical protein
MRELAALGAIGNPPPRSAVKIAIITGNIDVLGVGSIDAG